MPRDLYLVAFKGAPGSRSHFALWIPIAANSGVGKIINVVGSPQTGFVYQFKRQDDLANTKQNTDGPFLLGAVPDAAVVDGSKSEDATPTDQLERIARGTHLPVTSAELPTSVSSSPRPGSDRQHVLTKVLQPSAYSKPIPGVERCQEWTRRYVVALIAAHLLRQAALAVFDAAPTNNTE